MKIQYNNLLIKIQKSEPFSYWEIWFGFSGLVRVTGVEPARPSAQEPKSCVYANFTIPAQHCHYITKVLKVNIDYLYYMIYFFTDNHIIKYKHSELIDLIIRFSRFEAVIICTLMVTVSFIFALSFETKTATASAKAQTVELPVIMYHHITENPSKTGKYTVHREELEADLEYLKKHGYEPVTVAELISFVDGNGTLPSKPIMITFDDGFESFYEIAFPVFKRYNMKSVISVIGSVTEKYSRINDHNINYSNLSFDEISELNSSGIVEIQNHSYNMHKSDSKSRKGLSKQKSETRQQYKEALKTDLMKLQSILKENCGITPVAVAYPYGAYSKDTLEVIKECGFRCTLLCEERINIITSGNSDSLYNLGRYNRESGISTVDFFKDKLK